MLNEKYNKLIIGEFQDTIFHKDGRVEKREWEKNCIINSIGKLIASLFKRESGHVGLCYWAVGTGSDSWADENPVSAVVTDAGCLNEIGRLAILPTDISFIDSNGDITTSVTNIIQIQVTFGENDCNGVWREFSIYGGNATSALNSGIAINHKNHNVLGKNSTMTVQRQIRFTFN